MRWGIVGLGNIAHEFCECIGNKSEVVAVASRNHFKANSFAQKYNVEKAYGSYEELYKDPNVEVVYIATINSCHYDNIIKALEKKKHVLCEKAIWHSSEDMDKAYRLANNNNLLLAEAMTIFHMPLFDEIDKLIIQNKIGKVKYVSADLGSLKDDDPSSRFFDKSKGGGAMLDIGTYGLSFVLKFLPGEVTECKSTRVDYPTGADEMWSISLKTNENAVGNVNLCFRAKLPKRAIIAGELAYIEIYNYVRADLAYIVYPDGSREMLRFGKTTDALKYEIDNTESAIFNDEKDAAGVKITKKVVKIMEELLSNK